MNMQPALFDSLNARLDGSGVTRSVRRIKDLAGVFHREEARLAMDPEQIVYEVEMHDACGDVEGGLYFGISHLSPGKVGDEYFMTKGHFHDIRNRGEYYWGIHGQGILLLMDETRKAWAEQVRPGSLHYIGGHIAHRLINTGEGRLSVGACWPSDAGHDYGTIAEQGFSLRVFDVNRKAELVAVP